MRERGLLLAPRLAAVAPGRGATAASAADAAAPSVNVCEVFCALYLLSSEELRGMDAYIHESAVKEAAALHRRVDGVVEELEATSKKASAGEPSPEA